MTGSLSITVVDGVVVDKAKTSIAVGKEDVVNISGGTTPYTAASKDDKIATTTVKDAKLTIKGVKVGSTTITITDKTKNCYGSCYSNKIRNSLLRDSANAFAVW